MVVTKHITNLVVFKILAFWYFTLFLQTSIQDVAPLTNKVGRADTVVVRSLSGAFTCTTIVAWV